VPQLDATVKTVSTAQDNAAGRLETWNTLLIVLTAALALLTIALVVATLEHGTR
jgi:hypothetical protein